MINPNFRFFLLSLICICCLGACNNPDFEQTHSFDQNVWAYGDTVVFEFDVDDTTAIYDIFMDVTHKTSYVHANLYTRLLIEFPDGSKRQDRQPTSIELSNGKGVWNGECSSENCTITLDFMQKTKFQHLGKHIIKMAQYTRKEKITDLTSFRFYLYKKSPEKS